MRCAQAGILGLKENPYVTPLAVPLAIACWFYTGTLMSAYDVRGKYLTAEMAAHLDNSDAEKIVEVLDQGSRRSSKTSLDAASKYTNTTLDDATDPVSTEDAEIIPRRPSVVVTEKDPYWTELFELIKPRPEDTEGVAGMSEYVSRTDLESTDAAIAAAARTSAAGGGPERTIKGREGDDVDDNGRIRFVAGKTEPATDDKNSGKAVVKLSVL